MQVWYCPSHTRAWVVTAHRVLETRVILTHIAHNAKPVFGALSEPGADPLTNRHRKANQSNKKRKLKLSHSGSSSHAA